MLRQVLRFSIATVTLYRYILFLLAVKLLAHSLIAAGSLHPAHTHIWALLGETFRMPFFDTTQHLRMYGSIASCNTEYRQISTNTVRGTLHIFSVLHIVNR
ncbi:hypothetical protein BU25DRAFT_176537 [Macroventuria anomochaeta]|uniref:Uncharacterized protein n=1 Tax=Macroventuria anomochaeta TaxID=301207 RepID=A0ACB6RP50_9PLEO|nr:uncharacterized protein BU25DRAFT_176537 [Macroventuria anomochaeta]KAF2623554.1 hypothetical protein BU25DRAFT_176537 [Macroventuria anomochaeta]